MRKEEDDDDEHEEDDEEEAGKRKEEQDLAPPEGICWAPELSTPSLGPVFRPGSFFVGPGAQYGPPGGRNGEKPAVTIFS